MKKKIYKKPTTEALVLGRGLCQQEMIVGTPAAGGGGDAKQLVVLLEEDEEPMDTGIPSQFSSIWADE